MASEIRVNSLTNRSGLSTVSITDTGAVVAGLMTATTFSGPLTGAVTGNVTGNITGNVTGNIVGNVTGNVTGNTSGTAGGLTGSPNITVADITATGNVSIGGTLTYEDVTNIDSVGIITAQSDVLVGRNLSVISGISTFKSLDYAAIDSTISDTAVDVFIYDTSKDSDGGAWRKRTQNTSWYNEAASATRGTRKDFPAVAVLVLESLKLTIYDGDDPDLPMWMEFINTSGNLIGGSAMTAVTALNGIIVTGSGGYTMETRFISDYSLDWFTNQLYEYKGNIEQRNDTLGFRLIESYGIVNSATNDVAMTVLPNAPIDPSTGLPIPTIAVATNGGLSVITDSGSIFDDTTSAGVSSAGVESCAFSGTKVVYCRGGASGNKAYVQDASTISADFTGERMYRVSQFGETNEVQHVCHGLADIDEVEGSDDNLILGAEEGIAIINENLNSPTNGLVAKIASDYNTGWMQGNVKGAFLSDTTVESLSANTNLASSCVQDGTNRLSSETYTNGATSWQMVDNSGSANGYVVVAFKGLTVGQSYIVSMTWDGNATLDSGYQHRVSHLNGLSGENATDFLHWNKTNGSAETLTGVFTAQSTDSDDLIIYANAITLNVSNFNVRAVDDEDRSVNNKGLQVYGTITKSAVATGADLVAYSGWNISGGNYLEQSYNSDLDFGTGDYYISVWVRQTYNQSSHSQNYVFHRVARSGGSTSGARFELRVPTNLGNFRFYQNDGSNVSYSDSSGNSFPSALWTHVVCGRKDRNLPIYINGRYDTASLSGDSNVQNSITNTSAKLFMGGEHQDNNNPWGGDIALFRIGSGFPSPEQIKKMYEDENVLFQENAKCTLYGSSDAVTGLAFDNDTNLLHVGTSSGRSDFQGLSRINNNTTAVTTAITAQNEFIIEQ